MPSRGVTGGSFSALSLYNKNFPAGFYNKREKDDAMRLCDIVIIESYAVASQVFSKEAPPQDVMDRLKQFKELRQRNILKPEENDLTKWIKRGWKEFDSFITSAETRTSKREEKSASKKDSIRVAESDEWLVVIPLSKDASCFYGKGTQWCTAATKSMNYFDSYFYNSNVTLLYFINKKNGMKLAAAHMGDLHEWECYDANDERIGMYKISQLTGYSEDTISSWVRQHSKATDGKRNERFTPEAAAKEIDDYYAGFEKYEKELSDMIAKIESGDESMFANREKTNRELTNVFNMLQSNLMHIKHSAASSYEDYGKDDYAEYIRRYARKNHPDFFMSEGGERFTKIRRAYLKARKPFVNRHYQ